MDPDGSDNSRRGHLPPSSKKRAFEEAVFDVDAYEFVAAAPSTKGKRVATVALPVNEPIDVDNPSSWESRAPPAAAGSSSGRGSRPMLKFGGDLGVVLYRPKIEANMEEAKAEPVASPTRGMASVGAVAPSGGAPPAAEASLADGASLADDAASAGEMSLAAASSVGAPSVGAVVSAGGTSSAGMVASASGAASAGCAASVGGAASAAGAVLARGASLVGGASSAGGAASAAGAAAARRVSVVGGASSAAFVLSGDGSALVSPVAVRATVMSPRQRPSLRSKHTRRLPPRHAFVRRAPVMQVAPRMYADPPTPPPEFEEESDVEEGDDNDYGGVEDRDAQGVADDNDERAEVVEDDAQEVVRATRAVAGEADGTVAAAAPPAARIVSASDALAEQLAARSRIPRLFPAAFFTLGAQAVFAAVQSTRTGLVLPPTAPVVSQGIAPAGINTRTLPLSAGTPPPHPRHPSAGRVPTLSPALGDVESSSDMDDDALVAAYITPPASPAACPRYSGPSVGRRARSSGSQAMRASRGAANAVAPATAMNNGDLPSALTLRDVHVAVRNGFSSVRREMTRLRAELVVVKTQAASTLRRMDGLAASADGSGADSGAIMERLSQMNNALNKLGDRITVPSEAATRAGGAEQHSTGVIQDIKVRLCVLLDSSGLYEGGSASGHLSDGSEWIACVPRGAGGRRAVLAGHLTWSWYLTT